MSLINVTNLNFSYDGSYDVVFEDVSFQIDTDWRLGFIGRNGRGKTTFMKLLRGEYEYRGTINASVNFEYFPFEVSDKTKTALEINTEINPNCMEWELIRELNLLEVHENVLTRPFETLSNGEQSKVLLAALFLRENSFLLIDEPTNHLDIIARETVEKYLRSKKGFILTSHDRALLDGCVDHILSINKANIEIQKGNFSSWWENKQKSDSFELNENEKLKKDITRLKKAAGRTTAWSDKIEKSKYNTNNSGSAIDRGYVGHKSAKMMKRAKSIDQRSETVMHEKSKLLKNIESADDLKIQTTPYYSKRLIYLESVSVIYDGKQINEEFSLTVEQGDRIALRGNNGSGKSSILKLINGCDINHTGVVNKGGGLNVSYLSQSADYLEGDLSEFAEVNNIDESLFKAILRKLDFSREQFEKDMSEFSSGQKKKVLLGKSLCEKAHLIVWDEPLNFIDVISRMQIENMLLSFKPTILFVEHDRYFCEKIANKLVEIRVMK